MIPYCPVCGCTMRQTRKCPTKVAGHVASTSGRHRMRTIRLYSMGMANALLNTRWY